MHPPLYDIHKTWHENMAAGPVYDGPLPKPRADAGNCIDFLGFQVASPLGVPAGPLLDSRWTSLAAQLGFDIVTYKTIRSQPSQGHGLPNVLYVQARDDAPPGLPVQVVSSEPSPDEVAITNSFGMPSMDPQYLLQDIPAAQAALGPHQVLVVSVTGTPNRADGVDLFSDFVQAAELAVSAGARILEANLSCPNVGSSQGVLYTDPQAVAAVTQRLHNRFPDIPLILKVGAFEDKAQCAAVLRAAAAAGARAVSGINGLSRRVVCEDGVTPALGPDRPTSGVCGAPIRKAALEFVAMARQVIQDEGLDLNVIGVGGITRAQHAMDMLAAGADVVQSATGMMWNPHLAQEFHEMYTKKFTAGVVKPGQVTPGGGVSRSSCCSGGALPEGAAVVKAQ